MNKAVSYVLILIIVIILAYFHQATINKVGGATFNLVYRHLPTVDFLYY